MGIAGNELADQLAKKGLTAKPDRRDVYVSLSHLRRKAKEATIVSWKDDWEREASVEKQGLRARGLGKLYRIIAQGNLAFSLKPSIPALPRRNEAAYIQLKTGIGYLKAYQRLIGKREDDRCGKNCRKSQTTKHLVLECERYSEQRKQLREALRGIPLTLQVLFGTKRGKEALAKFLICTEICTAKWMQDE